MKKAFSVLELLVAMAIVAVCAGLSLLVFPRLTENARSAACLSNLRQLGTALNLYLGENRETMPTLQAGRRSKAEEVPVIDNTLDVYAKNPAVFACPSDKKQLAATTGTSYYWNTALNGQALASLKFLNLSDSLNQIPILADKEGFHPFVDKKVNLLYADGHVTKDLTFYTTP